MMASSRGSKRFQSVDEYELCSDSNSAKSLSVIEDIH